MTLPTQVPTVRAEGSELGPFSPIKILEVDLAEPLPVLSYGGQYRRAWVLVRLLTEPIGVCHIEVPDEGLSADQVAALLWGELSGQVAEKFAASGLPAPGALTGAGLRIDAAGWGFLRRRAAILAKAPFISVVVCTRDRPDQIRKCLDRLTEQEYPRFEVVVVDNAPTSNALADVVSEYVRGGANFRYCVEPTPGLSWARNAGVAAAASDIIAFLDDDDEPDRHWLAELAGGFARGADVGCVSGVIMPASLDTIAEQLFEENGGHSKGRGFAPEMFDRSGPQSPLFPNPPFGAGANMAFRRTAIEAIGGFDVALGAGTPTGGAEDTLALTLAMLAGYKIAYEPTALMWHHHRKDIEGLRRQLHNYSIALTAFYAALLRHRPSALLDLFKLLPAAAGYLKDAAAPHDGPEQAAEPDPLEQLDRRHLQGMLEGPLAYAKSVRIQRRARVGARRVA